MMTKGEQRIGVHQTTANDQIRLLRAAAAALIDQIDLIDTSTYTERGRLKALAQTAVEEAALWAEKALTTT
jgi:hypothetical protein